MARGVYPQGRHKSPIASKDPYLIIRASEAATYPSVR